MAEIKNTFSQGKMNKDLDERLIPNGQYRDALNVEITSDGESAETGSAGTISNIKGNVPLENVVPSDKCVCVGSVADEKNNKLYWFVKCEGFPQLGDTAFPNRDAIIEYDTVSKESTFLITDLRSSYTNSAGSTVKPILNFSGKKITAINIIDQYLIWSDGETEPKKINIEKAREATIKQNNGTNGRGSLSHHSYLYVNGVNTVQYLQEENITVIKKKPLMAPRYSVVSAKNSEFDPKLNPTPLKKAIFEKIFPRFCLRYKYQDGEYSAFGPWTNVVFNPEFVGDYSVVNAFTAKEPYNKAMVNAIRTINFYGLVTPDMPKDVVQIDILYKQENSTVIHNVGSIKNTDPEWFEDGNWFKNQGIADYESYNPTTKGVFIVDTENIHAALPENQFLRVWDAVPRKAQAQEVTGNRLVFANYTEGYDMVVDNSDFKPKVLGDFEPRQIDVDSIFRGEGAFGYSLNMSQNLTGRFENAALISSTRDGGNIYSYVSAPVADPSRPLAYAYTGYRGAGLPTIKSQRDYQLGVVFGDEYGRETPVFTSDLATVKIPWEGTYGLSASTSLSIAASLGNTSPSWAKYYKFYIKQSAGEYYNLAMDKVYRPATSSPEFDNGLNHVWVSFASSDRDKIDTGEYITIKKIINDYATQIQKENKYKVLDISNEMPDSIAFEYYNLGTRSNINSALTDEEIADAIPIFTQDPTSNEDNRIDRITNTIEISKPNWIAGNGAALTKEVIDGYTERDGGLYISWRRSTQSSRVFSKRYKVTSVTFQSDKYILKLAEFIQEQDAKLAANSSDLSTTSVGLGGTVTADTLTFQIERKEKKTKEAFDGRFFVKIAADYILEEYLLSEFKEEFTDFYVNGVQKLFYLADGVTTGFDASSAIVNSENSAEIQSYQDDGDVTSPSDIHSGGSLTNLQSEWQALMDDEDFGVRTSPTSNSSAGNGGFFIDAMYFAAINSDSENYYAKYAGQGWTGNLSVEYPEIEWGRIIDYRTNDDELAGSDWLTTLTTSDYGRDYNVAARRARYGWRQAGVNEDQETNADAWIESSSASNFGGAAYRSKWRNWNHGNFSTWQVLEGTSETVETDRESEVNGFEGILQQASPVHYSSPSDGGYRNFITNIYGKIPNGRTISKRVYKSTVNGITPSYLHLSYLGPGYSSNLFNRNSVPSDVGLHGQKALGRYLGGIWGGGAFTNQNGTNFGSSNIRFVEMEGTKWEDRMAYSDDGNIQPAASSSDTTQEENMPSDITRSKPPKPGDDTKYFGYDSSKRTLHLKQWVPGGDAGTIEHVYNFATQDLQQGAQFRFKNDTSEDIYTVLEKSELHIYNHTPWKARKVWNGTEYVWGNDSVEEAVAAWADTANADGQPDNNGQEFTDMLDRLEAFGDRSNRRTTYVLALDKPVQTSSYNPVLGADTDGTQVLPDAVAFTDIEFIRNNPMVLTGEVNKDPAIWETEPTSNNELDVYYEASNAIPTKLNKNNLDLFAPQGTRIEFPNMDNSIIKHEYDVYLRRWNGPMSSYNDEVIRFEVRSLNGGDTGFKWFSGDTNIDYKGQEVRFYRQDGSYTTATTANVDIEQFYIDTDNMTDGSGDYWKGKNTAAYIFIKNTIDPTKQVGLSWFNAFTFTDGVESNRIRDDFNEMTISNGARVSTTLDEPYKEEVKSNSLIYSGIYNSNSKLNSLNEFITAEKITKDLNPTYGSIQKLFSRNSDLIAFCEDRVVKILANKDAVFNADGNPQLIASNRVLGQATPFAGDFGISKNPESFAKDSYRAYFTDKQRGAVLRLSMDGLTPISEAGMGDWFRDELTSTGINIIGTFDDHAREYNVTIKEVVDSNRIQNNTFDYGSEVSTVNIVNPELCTNPDLSGGAEYTPVDLVNDIYYAGPSADSSLGVSLGFDVYSKVPIRNRSLGYKSTVRNWPAIAEGSIKSAAAAVPEVLAQNAEYSQFNDADISTPVHRVNFRTATANPFQNLDTYSTYGTDSDQESTQVNRVVAGVENPVGHNNQFTGTNDQSAPNVQRASADVADIETWTRVYDKDVGSHENYANIYWDSGLSPDIEFNPLYGSGGAGVIFSNMFFGGSVNAGGALNNYIEFPGYHNSAFNASVAQDVLDWDTSPNNTTEESFGTVYNNSVFHGEEFYVIFNVVRPESDANSAYSYRPFVQIFGDGQLVDESYLTTSNTITPTTGTNVNQVGFQAVNTYEFPIPGSQGTIGSTGLYYRIYFRFEDPNHVAGENTKIYQQLKVRVGFTGDDTYDAMPNDVAPYGILTRAYLYKASALLSPQIVGQVGQPAQAAVPSSDRPAWSEVIHELHYENVWNITAGTGNRFYKAEQALGLANPGEWVTSTDDNGNTVQWYDFVEGNDVTIHPSYDNAVQDVNSFAGAAPTEYITTPNGGNLPSFNQYTQATSLSSDPNEIPVDCRGILIQNDGSNEGSFYFSQPLNNESKYVVGNWYCVDVFLDSSYPNVALNNLLIPGVLGAGSGLDNAYQTDHTQDIAGYPSYHFGKIGGSSTAGFSKSIILMPVINNEWPLGNGNEVYRAIFQYNATEEVQQAQGQNFVLQGWNADCLIRTISLYNITEQATMGKPNGWNVPQDAWVSEHSMHEFITEQTNDNLEPECYFRHNMLCWNTERSSHVYWNNYHYNGNGPLDETEESYSGYLLNFTIEDNPDFESFDGKLRIRVTNRWNEQTNSLDGAYIRDIDTPGDYSILMNFNSIDPTIISAPEGSEVSGVAFANQSDYAQIENHRSKIVVFPENGGCTGALSSLSLVDATQYYEGGGIDSWVITGYDRSEANYISWNQENLNIVFDNAPVVEGSTGQSVQTEQRVGHIESNSNVTFGLTTSAFTGSIKAYYYNSSNKGFSVVYNSNDSHSSVFSLNEARPGDALINTLVIKPNEDNTSCVIDDIFLFKSADAGFEPTTISYSEEVKGWTSLKSFHPESGVSVARQYYTMLNGELWQHHANDVRNNFYGQQYDSDITLIMNADPSTVKNFRAVSYEGTQAKVHESNQVFLGVNDLGEDVYASSADNYNFSSKHGWFAEDIHTDTQHGSIKEFIKKEGKWFNNIKGKNTGDSVTMEEIGQLSFQGLGFVESITSAVDSAPAE